MLISQPENRFYFSGFNGSAGYLFITAKEAVLATDFRYIEQVKEQSPDFRVHRIGGNTSEWFPALVAEMGIRTLGFEAESVSFSLYRLITEGLKQAGTDVSLKPETGLGTTLRAVKEPEELAAIEKAVDITDRAFVYIEDRVKSGVTEREIAWELERFQREQGSQALPFDIIVGSGPNAALPHAKPTDRKIEPGDAVVIDMGARVDGYCSDFTRTLFAGEPDSTMKKVYDTVLAAQLAAIAIITQGMTGSEADGIARTVIEESGYGEYFGHSLGHGVGLAEHEQPTLGPNSTEKLVPGMVFSIEPGIYLPGRGGVRIEDLVIMEEGGGVRVLSHGTK